jgi:hypothetical protein
MAHDYGGINPKDRGTTICFIIKPVEIGILDTPFYQHPVHGFDLLENNVPDKTVAYDHINVIAKQFPPLNIANEMKIFGILHQLEGRLGGEAALLFFHPDIKQTNPGFFNMKYVLRKKRTQDPELIHDVRFCIRVGSYIDKNRRSAVLLWDISRRTWPDNSLDGVDAVDGATIIAPLLPALANA